MTLSHRGLAVAFIAVLAGYVAAGIAVLDIRVRKDVEEHTSFNSWGYRGLARFHKEPGEHRVAIVGGSAAFGYGVPAHLTLGRVLEVRLNQPNQPRRPAAFTSVAELAEQGAGAASYVSTLEDYAYLNPDVICIYDGYAAVDDPPSGPGRRSSWVFRHTGYRPVLFDAAAIRADRETHVPVTAALRNSAGGDMSCSGWSSAYCAAMVDAVQWGLGHGKAVVVVTPPFVSQRHEAQQRSLAAVLRSRFGGDSHFAYLDRGTTVDVRNRALSFDGEYLTPGGIERIAESLIDPLFDAMGSPQAPGQRQ